MHSILRCVFTSAIALGFSSCAAPKVVEADLQTSAFILGSSRRSNSNHISLIDKQGSGKSVTAADKKEQIIARSEVDIFNNRNFVRIIGISEVQVGMYLPNSSQGAGGTAQQQIRIQVKKPCRYMIAYTSNSSENGSYTVSFSRKQIAANVLPKRLSLMTSKTKTDQQILTGELGIGEHFLSVQAASSSIPSYSGINFSALISPK